MIRTVIIGITGASSSGKSTVCKSLCNLIPNSYLVQQDAYFKEEKDVPFDNEHQIYNWDCVEAIDMPQMVEDLKRVKQGGEIAHSSEMTNFKEDTKFILEEGTVKKAKALLDFSNTRVVFVDGFLIFGQEELLDLFDMTFFVKTGYETLKERREGRIYIVDGEAWVHPPEYFDRFVWKGYFDYHSRFFDNSLESEARKTGGKLSESFKLAHKVVEVSSDKNTDFNDLILAVVKDITQLM